MCVCRFRKSALILHSILDWRNGAMIIFIYPGIFLVMNLGNFSFLTCFWKSPKCTQFTSWVDISTFVWCMGFKIVLYVHNNAILIADPPLRSSSNSSICCFCLDENMWDGVIGKSHPVSQLLNTWNSFVVLFLFLSWACYHTLEFRKNACKFRPDLPSQPALLCLLWTYVV